jgi:hypothetical protein
MTLPFVAKYGFKNNSHDLLEWDGKGQPPRELLGLTDKPAGHVTPSEKWWPAVNCGKVGDWWAIWLVEPDPSAPRGGMVKSHVLLWPINEIAGVNDLGEYISTLIGQDLETPSEIDQLVINNLLNELASNDHVFILEQVKLAPHIMESIWKSLWDKAKENFAIRVSFTPPQSFNTTKHPTFYCVPSSLTNQWFNQRVKLLNSFVTSELSRAAKYLNGQADPTISKLMTVCGLETGNIRFIGRLARTADNIDLFHEQDNATNTISALRSIIACSEKITDAQAYKAELMLALKAHIDKNSITVEQVLSLSNISEEDISEESFPKQELINWIADNLNDVDADKQASTFERCNPEKSRDWWWRSVEIGVSNFLDTTNADDKLVSWLLMDSFSSLAKKFVYSASNIDTRIFELAKKQQLSSVGFKKLESIAIANNFPKLYSLVIYRIYPENSLIGRQMNSMDGWEKGVPYLIDKLQSSTLLEEIEIEELSYIIPLVADLSKKDVKILNGIDIAKKGAYTLWCIQLENGGSFYPPLADKNSFKKKLYDNLNSDLPSSLLDPIIAEMSEYLLSLVDRTDFWARFDIGQRRQIANKLVDAITSSSNISFKLSAKESELTQALNDYINSNSELSQQLLISCLRVPITINEQVILKWILKTKSFGWANHAQTLGEIILKNNWNYVAEKLYKESYGFLASKEYFKPTVDRCVTLLGYWERTKVSLLSEKLSTPSSDVLLNRLSVLAAELAHDRLDSIWLRAGGNLGVLHSYGSSSERWHSAVRAANSGALVGGLKSLIEQLLEDFPHNTDLKELNSLF